MSSVTKCGRSDCQMTVEKDQISCATCDKVFHLPCSGMSSDKYEANTRSKTKWTCVDCEKSKDEGGKAPKRGHSSTVNSTNDTEKASQSKTAKTDASPSKRHRPETTLKQICFITGNANKLREVVQILGPNYKDTLTKLSVDLPEYQGTIDEIATKKCEFAAEHADGPVLVEDTALCFDTLKGMPGPYIKWFLNAVGPEGLHKMIVGFGEKANAAQAVCTFAYTAGRKQPVKLFSGVTKGFIVSPRGTSGFGWDPCFLPEGFEETYGELDKDQKNEISHRYRAVLELKKFLDAGAVDSE